MIELLSECDGVDITPKLRELKIHSGKDDNKLLKNYSEGFYVHTNVHHVVWTLQPSRFL